MHPARSLRQGLITGIDDELEDGCCPRLLHLIEHNCFDSQDDSLACLANLNRRKRGGCGPLVSRSSYLTSAFAMAEEDIQSGVVDNRSDMKLAFLFACRFYVLILILICYCFSAVHILCRQRFVNVQILT